MNKDGSLLHTFQVHVAITCTKTHRRHGLSAESVQIEMAIGKYMWYQTEVKQLSLNSVSSSRINVLLAVTHAPHQHL